MCLRYIRIAIVVGMLLSVAAASLVAEPSAGDLEYFEQHVRPVLAENCYRCHSARAERPRAGLRLDASSGWQRGGDSGPAVVAGDPEASLLLKAIRQDEDVSPMPPDGKLSGDVVERVAEWIRRGAPAPEDETAPAAPVAVASEHWAFRPPLAAELSRPVTPGAHFANRVDMVLAKHWAANHLQSSPEASRPTQIRRLYYDLLGLPPQFDEVQSFVLSGEPDAYERLVERLLASPRFGERWARYWLDVARFADTKGYVFTADRNYPDAYKYRDWVIGSFNCDRPYDEFIKYQLAADQLAPGDAAELAAMGFLTLGRRFLNNRHDIIDDRIDVTTRGLMGLTVTCARCHSHKFDPIPTEDYYSLYGVFASSREPGDAPSPLRLEDADRLTTPVVFLRGQPDQRGAEVPRQFLGFLSGPDRQPFQHGSGRLEMAEAIAAADNPLTARVLVNRVWGRLFGSYLVETPSDFGTRCSQPLLAELLDDLAVELVRHDWSFKWLVRELVLSSAYRQTSDVTPQAAALDPENRLYGRMNRRRLDFEAMRDALLLVSGQLQDQPIGGPSVDISSDRLAPRRSVYAQIDRQNFPGLFRAFDVASPDTHAPKRFETTVPQQALYLLNSPFIQQCAQHLAASTAGAAQQDGPRVRQLYRRALGREPDEWELERACAFVADAPASNAGADAWAQLSQALLVCNEFSYLD